MQDFTISIMKKPKFTWKVGTIQLFIVCDKPFLFVPASMSEYYRDKQVGTKWERKVAQWACDYLNKSKQKTFTEKSIKKAIKIAEEKVKWE